MDTSFLSIQNKILLSGISAELFTEVNSKFSIKEITYKNHTFQMICISDSTDYKKIDRLMSKGNSILKHRT